MVSPYRLPAKREKRVRVLRQHARLLRLGAGVDLDEEPRRLAALLDFHGKGGGDLLAVDRLDDVEGLDRLARLVGLQRADQVKLDRLADFGCARAQVAPFRDRLLHAIFSEPRLAADGDRRPDLVGGECLGDGDQLDRIRRPAAVARAPRDLLPQRGEAPNRVQGAVVNEVSQSRLQSLGDAGSRHCTA